MPISGVNPTTPYDRCLRFGPRVAATPARLASIPPAQLWTDQTCTGKLISASPIAPRIRLSDRGSRLRPRLAAPACGQAYQAKMAVQVREWIGPAPSSPDLVLETQPPAPPHRGIG